MLTYVLRRLLGLIPILFAVAVIVFLSLRLLPGDAVSSMGVEARLPEEVREQLRAYMGLDQPLISQFLAWIGNVLQGDLGYSLTSGHPIAPELARRFPVTLELLALAALLSLLVGVPAGLLSAVRRDRPFDHVARIMSMAALALPNFWIATLLVLVFTVKLGWFPVLGWVPFSENPLGHFYGLLLPAVALAITQGAALTRMMRSSMLDVLDREHLDTARSKGLTESRVILRHGVRNGSVPVVTLVGLEVGTLLGGAVVVETIFGLPGVGSMIVNAVVQRDLPVVQATVLVLAVAAVVLTLIVDVIVGLVDPRTRAAHA